MNHTAAGRAGGCAGGAHPNTPARAHPDTQLRYVRCQVRRIQAPSPGLPSAGIFYPWKIISLSWSQAHQTRLGQLHPAQGRNPHRSGWAERHPCPGLPRAARGCLGPMAEGDNEDEVHGTPHCSREALCKPAPPVAQRWKGFTAFFFLPCINQRRYLLNIAIFFTQI